MRKSLDELDKEILMLVQDDARISHSEMAKRLKVPESTIRYRLKRLLNKKVITRMTALLDPRKLGLNLVCVVMLKVDPELLNDAIKRLASFEEAHHIFQTTGEYDAIIVAHLRDTNHLNDFKKRVKMVKGVRDVMLWLTTGLVKIETRFNLRSNCRNNKKQN